MPSASEIARQALLKEEEPERKRKAREAEELKEKEIARAKREKRNAMRRLKNSTIAQWFPNVEWEFVEAFNGTLKLAKYPGRLEQLVTRMWVFQSGKQGEYDMLRLGLLQDGNVVFVMWPTRYPDRSRGEFRWNDCEIVESAADVARAHSRYHSRTAIPPGVE